jgi:pimeloyl-ACP methyl ester carboxylesterase
MRRRIMVGFCCLCLAAGLDPAAQQRPDLLGKLKVAKRTILVFGQQIAYYEAGRGKTVVLLPNLTWDSHAWSQNLPAISAKYHVIALDLPGTGDSAKPLIEYKMDTWTDFIAEFLRLKRVPKATIVGAVMGGALAVQFALDHPELSEGLVCAASNSGPGKHAGGLLPENWPSVAGTKRALLASFHDKSLVTDALVRARFEDRLRIDDGYTVARHLADHRAPYSVKELSAIRVPALFVWCREDEITPLKWGEDYAAAVPGAQLAVIEGCGHLPNLEKPADFNKAVTEFLDKQIR